jgi:hypothetical protein
LDFADAATRAGRVLRSSGGNVQAEFGPDLLGNGDEPRRRGRVLKGLVGSVVAVVGAERVDRSLRRGHVSERAMGLEAVRLQGLVEALHLARGGG